MCILGEMRFIELYKILEKNKLFIFSYKDISNIFPKEIKGNIKKLIYRWKKAGWIHAIKRELYELTYPRDLNIPDLYIANKLYTPSYISMDTVLSMHSIIPDISIGVISITTKPTRKFKNEHGLFIYRTMKPKFFMGYHIEKYEGFEVLVAEPEKALIDYLYFNSRNNTYKDFKDKRFDKSIISKLNQKKLNKYAHFCKINLKEFYANI